MTASLSIFLITNAIMTSNNDPGSDTFKPGSTRNIMVFVLVILLFFSIDVLSLFLYKFLKDHKTSFWAAIGIHIILVIVVAVKYKSLIKKIKLWLFKSDENVIEVNPSDDYFYFRRD